MTSFPTNRDDLFLLSSDKAQYPKVMIWIFLILLGGHCVSICCVVYFIKTVRTKREIESHRNNWKLIVHHNAMLRVYQTRRSHRLPRGIPLFSLSKKGTCLCIKKKRNMSVCDTDQFTHPLIS